MSHDFLHPDDPIDKRPGKLPHWSQDEVMQFVTFRLGDSIPVGKLRIWREERQVFLNIHPEPWDTVVEHEYHRQFPDLLEQWMDQGSGSCLLGDEASRLLLEEVLMRCQGDKVVHHAWVIMPNHVHLLLKPMVPLGDLVKAWKSFSARRIAGKTIWQANYRDTLIRDGEHFANAVRYIRRNPVKAKLRDGEFTLWQSERALLVK